MQNAVYKPSNTEIQQLAQILSLPGYQVLEKIYFSELDLLQVAFMNIDGGEDDYEKKLAAKHALAKGGAKFYAQVSEKIAGYVNRMKENSEQRQVLPDATEETFG